MHESWYITSMVKMCTYSCISLVRVSKFVFKLFTNVGSIDHTLALKVANTCRCITEMAQGAARISYL